MNGIVDFAAVFARLAAGQQREETFPLDGVNLRLARVAAGGEVLLFQQAGSPA